MKRNWSAREKILAGVVFVLALAAAGYRILEQGYFVRLSSLDSEMERVYRDVRRDTAAVRDAQVFIEGYADRTNIFRQPDDGQDLLAYVQSGIEESARRAGITVADIKPQKAKKTGIAAYVPVGLVIEGPMNGIMEFVYHAQQGPYYFDVQEFFLERKSPNAPELRCRLVMGRILVEE
ncbi:MAG: hypothetical protein Q8Q08_04560 [Candidatus Omnitrophota bacterium]|nr:hypothetical protein [Candidatus Omnitrophota bacterium]MDZ4241369.1 hypothetical protein [Candidatus Omnitrophota bacterium]